MLRSHEAVTVCADAVAAQTRSSSAAGSAVDTLERNREIPTVVTYGPLRNRPPYLKDRAALGGERLSGRGGTSVHEITDGVRRKSVRGAT